MLLQKPIPDVKAGSLCPSGCICLACSAKRRAEWYLGGAEDAFWAGIRVGFWITVGALIVCSLVYVGMYFAVGWIK